MGGTVAYHQTEAPPIIDYAALSNGPKLEDVLRERAQATSSGAASSCITKVVAKFDAAWPADVGRTAS